MREVPAGERVAQERVVRAGLRGDLLKGRQRRPLPGRRHRHGRRAPRRRAVPFGAGALSAPQRVRPGRVSATGRFPSLLRPSIRRDRERDRERQRDRETEREREAAAAASKQAALASRLGLYAFDYKSSWPLCI